MRRVFYPAQKRFFLYIIIVVVDLATYNGEAFI